MDRERVAIKLPLSEFFFPASSVGHRITMSSIKLYGYPYSTCVSRVLCCLFEKQLDFHFVSLDMLAGEHKSEPVVSINPFGQVPAVQDGDLNLFESRAITQYLVRGYPEKGTQLISTDRREMGATLTWIEVEDHQYDPPASRLAFELFVKPMIGMGAADEALVEENKAKLCKVLDVYETRLSRTKYLAGDCFTLADLHHLPTLHYLMETEAKELFESRPHLSAWASDILSRPSWSKVLEMRSKA